MPAERALRLPDGRAARKDGRAQKVCGDCCGQQGDCYLKFVRCPADGPCASSAPDIFVPCSGTCPGSGDPVRLHVISLPGDPDLAGWCWHYEADPDCPEYTTEDPPPPGRCPLPPDAIVIESGWECVSGCNDPVCNRRGDYLIPDVCEGACGPNPNKLLVCPSDDMDLSMCRWTRLNFDAEHCGCISVGPTSRHFTGDPTGYDIVYGNNAWSYALDGPAACCECCSTHCRRCQYERIPLIGVTCIPNGSGKYCCCAQTRRVVVVGFGTWRYDQDSASSGLRQLNEGKSNFISNTRFAYNGTDWDSECLGVTARETRLFEQWQDGNLEIREFYEDSKDVCDPNDSYVRDPCIIKGQDVAAWGGQASVWTPVETDNFPNNWPAILGNINQLIDPANFKCSGGTVWSCPFGYNCTGLWSARGGCGNGSFVAEVHTVGSSGGTRYTNDATLRIGIYSVIESHFEDCGGGCGYRKPRVIDIGADTGVVTNPVALGAGDIL